MPPKRKADHPPAGYPPAAAEANKRLRGTLDSIAEELICPITRDLPADPVTAEDGRVYERHAINVCVSLSSVPIVKELM